MPSRLVPILFAGMAPGIQGSDNYEPGENRRLERNGERGLFSGEVGERGLCLSPSPPLPAFPAKYSEASKGTQASRSSRLLTPRAIIGEGRGY